MYFVTLHDTESEEIIGHVNPVEKMDFELFYDEIRESWVKYQGVIENDLDGDYCIENYVEWHNENYMMQIDSCVCEYIQL